MTGAGFPHSDTPGSTLRCQLPRAYRRLVRPSSALDAKASTMCPLTLVTQTLNKNNVKTVQHHAKRPGKTAQLLASSFIQTKCSTLLPRTGPKPYSKDARVHFSTTKHHTHQPPTPPQTRQDEERRHRSITTAWPKPGPRDPSEPQQCANSPTHNPPDQVPRPRQPPKRDKHEQY
jgi:hypothetical protein